MATKVAPSISVPIEEATGGVLSTDNHAFLRVPVVVIPESTTRLASNSTARCTCATGEELSVGGDGGTTRGAAIC
jgi:hypothetical protein